MSILGKTIEIHCNPSQVPLRNCNGRFVFLASAMEQKSCPDSTKVCYIGNHFPDHIFSERVCAVAYYKTDNILFVSEKASRCYAPEIIDTLQKLDLPKPSRLRCLFEKSCGAVIYRWNNQQIQFLLIQNKHASYFTYPKGHIEEGESEKQTAEREIFEETGLKIKILDGFRQTCEYRPQGVVKKHVVLFLAKSPGIDIKLQSEEIDDYSWLEFNEAKQKLKFENDRYVLTRALDWIKKNDNQY